MSWVIELAVRPGGIDDFRALMKEMVDSTSEEPGALTYEWFVTDDETAVHIYERYADSPAVLTHLTNFGDRFAARFFDAVDVTRLTVYGEPTEAARATLAGLDPACLSPFGGFCR